jgi:hypothetical protein
MPRPRKDSPAVTLPPPAPELRDLPLAQVAERNLRLLVLDGPLRPGVIAPIGEIAAAWRPVGSRSETLQRGSQRMDCLRSCRKSAAGCRFPHRPSELGGIGLDLMPAIPAPHDEPDASGGGIT